MPSPAAPAPAAPPPGDAPKDAPAFGVEIGRVTADTGALSDAAKSLRKARDRLLACTRAGGVAPEGGEVELRFLVQGRGRAEGVSVQRRRGVTAAAAKCVADVIDRRFVGYPDEPAVGATLVIAMKKK